MGQLTWREMQAPDLGTSLRGFQQFTSLLDSALGRAQGAVDRIDANMNERANTGALRIAAAVQDPEQAKTLLTDPRLMNDRVSAATIGALAARPGQLINQAAAETNLADLKRESGYATAFDALMPDALKIRELRRAEGAGTLGEEGRAQLSGLEASLTQRAGAAGAKNALLLAGNLDDAETGALNRAGARLGMDQTRLGMEQTRQNMNQSATSFGWQVEDRNDQKLGQAAFLQISNSSMSKEQALAAFNSGELSRLPPGAKMVALQQLNGTWGNIFTPEQMGEMSGFTGSSGGGAGTGMDVMNYEARNGGFGKVPSNIKTMGDASAYADRINASGVPSSAMGPYQIVGNTRDSYAAKLFGSGWKSLPYSVENETKIATAIFNANKGSAQALRSQWVSLSPAEAERVRKMPPQQALAVIAKKESGASAASLFGTQTGAALRVGQDREGKSSATRLISDATNGPANPLEVTDELLAGRFKGANRGFVKSQLDDIVRRGGGNITYRQAGTILNDALRENEGSGEFSILDPTTWLKNDPILTRLNGKSVRVNKAGDRINSQFVTQEIERARNGGVVNDATREADVSSRLQGAQAAQVQLARARAEYQAAVRGQAVRPGMSAQLPRLKAQLDAAQAAAINAQSGVEAIAAPRSAIARTTGKPEGGGFWDTIRGLTTVMDK